MGKRRRQNRVITRALEDRYSLELFRDVDKDTWWWEIRRVDTISKRARRSNTKYDSEEMARKAGSAALTSLLELLYRSMGQK